MGLIQSWSTLKQKFLERTYCPLKTCETCEKLKNYSNCCLKDWLQGVKSKAGKSQVVVVVVIVVVPKNVADKLSQRWATSLIFFLVKKFFLRTKNTFEINGTIFVKNAMICIFEFLDKLWKKKTRRKKWNCSFERLLVSLFSKSQNEGGCKNSSLRRIRRCKYFCFKFPTRSQW